jgi:hypothetical protein
MILPLPSDGRGPGMRFLLNNYATQKRFETYLYSAIGVVVMVVIVIAITSSYA